MRHLGDITKLRGYAVPVVDCITGGSPCQDLSVAGKRAGLQGKRSGLFMEQIRIIKEMRARDRLLGRTGADVRPRYMVWENVIGSFSSNKGKDFAAVLEETIRVIEPEAPSLSVPRSGGGWPNAGCIYDILGRWSVAWRVHDAQFWGVPQRRKRIALVADFGGSTAPEILFERESVSRDFGSGRAQGQGTATGIESGTDSAICIQGNCIDRADTAGCNGRGWRRGASYTLNTIDRPAVFAPRKIDAMSFQERAGKPGGGKGILIQNERTGALSTVNNQYVAAFGTGGIGVNFNNVVRENKTVRRLTPLECERLQGYPDNWTRIGELIGFTIWTDENGNEYPDAIYKYVGADGKMHKTSDSARYKALGNSIALPFWDWLLARISAHYDRPATLGSLFDGIGGFPLCWERHNGAGTAIWASEIEEFCIAVTQRRFSEVRLCQPKNTPVNDHLHIRARHGR